MALVSDYENRKIKRQIILARWALQLFGCPVLGSFIRRKVQEKIKSFQLHPGNLETVSILIRNAELCAVGVRVCASTSPGSPVTESVFLDELATAMVRSGQARFVNADEAITILGRYPDNPLVVASVSGRQQEICRSYPKDCIYWNLKKEGLKF